MGSGIDFAPALFRGVDATHDMAARREPHVMCRPGWGVAPRPRGSGVGQAWPQAIASTIKRCDNGTALVGVRNLDYATTIQGITPRTIRALGDQGLPA